MCVVTWNLKKKVILHHNFIYLFISGNINWPNHIKGSEHSPHEAGNIGTWSLDEKHELFYRFEKKMFPFLINKVNADVFPSGQTAIEQLFRSLEPRLAKTTKIRETDLHVNIRAESYFCPLQMKVEVHFFHSSDFFLLLHIILFYFFKIQSRKSRKSPLMSSC